MKLLIDVGNSFIKWCSLNEGELSAVSNCATDTDSLQRSLLAVWRDSMQPSAVFISSVVAPGVNEVVSNVVQTLWKIKPSFVQSPASGCGLFNSYDVPAELGIDRWMAMVGASRLTDGPCIVIDCGTAVTVDVVNKDRRFVGGVILPGLQLSRTCLARGTARLGDASGNDDETYSPVACSTHEGVSSGTLLGLAGGIERVVREQQKMLNGHIDIFITGGNATTLLPYLSLNSRHYPELVLLGLKVYVEQQD